jgi:protein O-GlcNAc transferase
MTLALNPTLINQKDAQCISELIDDKGPPTNENNNILDTMKLEQAIRLAQRNLKSGNTLETKRICRDILCKFPNNLKIKTLLHSTQTSDGSVEYSKNEPPVAEFREIAQLFKSKNFNAALNSAHNLLKRFEKSGQLHSIVGACHAEMSDFENAINSYEVSLKLNPTDPTTYLNLGLALFALGNAPAAMENYLKTLELSPHDAEALCKLGIAQMRTGDVQGAIKSLQEAITSGDNSADALLNLGKAYKVNLQLEEAAKCYKKLIKIVPQNADIYNDLGTIYDQRGNRELAKSYYRQAFSFNPKNPYVLNNLGNCARADGEIALAKDYFRKSIAENSGYKDPHLNLGAIAFEEGKFEDSLKSYEKALEIDPNLVVALKNMGVLLKRLDKLDLAISYTKQALNINPNSPMLLTNLGSILSDLRQYQAAIQYYEKALALDANYSDALNNMGIACKALGKIDISLSFHTRAVQNNPNSAYYHFNLGAVLLEKGHSDELINTLTKVLELDPTFDEARALKLYQLACLCDWDAIEDERIHLASLGVGNKKVDPFSAIVLEDAPERHLQRAKNFSSKSFLQQEYPLVHKPTLKPEKLRIGYFSTDFKNHPVTYAILDVLENHDRDKFEIFAYSLNTTRKSDLMTRIIKAVDVFDEVSDMADSDVALLARQDKIDIAIDLTGYTKGHRTGIFAYRAAPIQINYLGYPGTMGAEFIDYIIADTTIIPEVHQKHFTEAPIYMPYSAAKVDTSIPIANDKIERTELGLPEKGFVFCAINNSYKYSPLEFDIWMRLLSKVEGSVLWLLDRNLTATDNLKKQAEKRGIAKERLVFQPTMVTDAASQSRYLSQFQCADLYLDTFVYGAGSTANNALFAGLPVLTMTGAGVTTRMAASYLNALGLSELVKDSSEDYENCALELALNPLSLKKIREKLVKEIDKSPIVNTQIYTKHLENGYRQAYDLYFSGEEKRPIYVPK